MAHKHSVYDTDTHFTISPITRTISYSSSSKNKIMQYDHDSERFTFEIPRYVEGHDFMLCNNVEIHYNNVDSQTNRQINGLYNVTDMQISPDSENTVIFSWLISQNATKYAGSLNFSIRFACLDANSLIGYAWHTEIYSGISIRPALYNSNVIVTQYADVLEEWKQLVVPKQSDLAQNDPNSSDYVKNRTHYMEVEKVNALTFDGVLDGKEVYYISDTSGYVKLSDDVVAIDDVLGATLKQYITGTEYVTVITEDYISDNTSNTYPHFSLDVQNCPVLVVLQDGYTFNTTTLSKGIYSMFYCTSDKTVVVYPTSLTCLTDCFTGTGVIYHTIDLNYLPEDIANAPENIADVQERVAVLEEDIANNLVPGVGSFTATFKDGSYTSEPIECSGVYEDIWGARLPDITAGVVSILPLDMLSYIEVTVTASDITANSKGWTQKCGLYFNSRDIDHQNGVKADEKAFTDYSVTVTGTVPEGATRVILRPMGFSADVESIKFTYTVKAIAKSDIDSETLVYTTSINAANGVAGLDENAKLVEDVLPDFLTNATLADLVSRIAKLESMVGPIATETEVYNRGITSPISTNTWGAYLFNSDIGALATFWSAISTEGAKLYIEVDGSWTSYLSLSILNRDADFNTTTTKATETGTVVKSTDTTAIFSFNAYALYTNFIAANGQKTDWQLQTDAASETVADQYSITALYVTVPSTIAALEARIEQLESAATGTTSAE